MLFKLQAECTFSKDIEPARADIETFIAEANKALLKKGAPRGKEEEAAEVKDWKVSNDRLELSVESGRYVRAHDGLLRLAKALGDELGEKHKIGLRDIKGLEYQVVLPTPALSEQIKQKLATLPSEVKFTEEGVVLILRDLDRSTLQGNVVDRLVGLATSALEKAPPTPPAEPKVVKQGPSVEHPFKEDPFELAKERGWVIPFPGRGQFIYAAPYAKLLRALEDLCIEKVALELGFEESMFPKLIPLEVMQKMPGYLDELPEGMYYVCPPPREPEAFTDFKKELKLTRKIPKEELKGCIKDPAYVLAPAQCEPFYQSFAGRRVRLEDLPVKFFDRSGWTYRWEGGGVEGFIRTQEFRRIEFVFMGEPDDVVKIRDALRDKSIELAEQLGMEWRLLVATPFYLRKGGI
ncbi:MAG: serine--tRNA ligase, partial [Candidatus Hadarchaeota archaeon]|nr:serine--tRNA ligase [Candidatus Hadarchaeota archaeon]